LLIFIQMAVVKKESTSTETKSGVTLISAYEAVWKKYTDFNGRLSRKGYWYFAIVNILISFSLAFLDRLIFKGELNSSYGSLAPLSSIYSLVMLVPLLAAQTRRLHDRNRSGWFLLLVLIPIVGQIIVLVFLLQKGNQTKNDYGPVSHE